MEREFRFVGQNVIRVVVNFQTAFFGLFDNDRPFGIGNDPVQRAWREFFRETGIADVDFLEFFFGFIDAGAFAQI